MAAIQKVKLIFCLGFEFGTWLLRFICHLMFEYCFFLIQFWNFRLKVDPSPNQSPISSICIKRGSFIAKIIIQVCH